MRRAVLSLVRVSEETTSILVSISPRLADRLGCPRIRMVGRPACRKDADPDEGGGFVATGVNLTLAGLSGTLSSELGSLADLEVLALGVNMLRWSIPQEVASLTKLGVLDLKRCSLAGTLPPFESPRLTRLLSADNAISGSSFCRKRRAMRSVACWR